MLEVRANKEKLMWMTGTSKLKATFKDLVATMKLSYHVMKRGKLVNDLPVLGTDEIFGFRY